VKRTAERYRPAMYSFSRPLHGLRPCLLIIPAMNRWAIFRRPLTRTKETPLAVLQFLSVAFRSSTMLHIHNGDATAEIAKASTLPGEHFAFREALLEGPTPAGLANDEWRSVRARHLSESYGVPVEQCERKLIEQETKVATFAEHEEVVFWFEHDLFCQINLLYLLDWFSRYASTSGDFLPSTMV
jgi:hypothetical protein